MRGREYAVNSLQALSLVARCSCSAYDCEFAALAKDLAVPLVTADRQILAQFPGLALSLDSFVSEEA